MITAPTPTPEQKLRGVLEYCLLHGSSSGKVPKTKLFKLIYLADFSNYYFTGKPISGEIYKNRPYGPVSDSLFALVDEMAEEGDISIDNGEVAKFHKLAVDPIAIKYLSDEELNVLKRVCDYWREKSTKEIKDFSHAQRPWFLTDEGEEIPYELILQEEHPYKPHK